MKKDEVAGYSIVSAKHKSVIHFLVSLFHSCTFVVEFH